MAGNDTLSLCSDPKYVFQSFDNLAHCYATYGDTTGANFTHVVETCLTDYCEDPYPDLGGCGNWNGRGIGPFAVYTQGNQSFWNNATCVGVSEGVNSDIGGPGVSHSNPPRKHPPSSAKHTPTGLRFLLDAIRNGLLFLDPPPLIPSLLINKRLLQPKKTASRHCLHKANQRHHHPENSPLYRPKRPHPKSNPCRIPRSPMLLHDRLASGDFARQEVKYHFRVHHHTLALGKQRYRGHSFQRRCISGCYGYVVSSEDAHDGTLDFFLVCCLDHCV